MISIPDRVRAAALAAPRLPAFIYDLTDLAEHARAIRSALPDLEVCYAVKANPDAPILHTLAPHVDGFEVSSGGELAHLHEVLPKAPVAFGGPGKTDEELALALDLEVARFHVESPHELRRLAAFGRPADILLRANLEVPSDGAALAMSGPFGMDEAGLAECATLLHRFRWLRLRGVHAHLASGLDAPAMAGIARAVLDWALPWLESLPRPPSDPEVNVGGGMAVDYTRPASRFDWLCYSALLGSPPARVRIEPGRSLTAYCGWYVTDVLDLKQTRGETYAVLRGGTHHLRTPVAKGHDQPFAILPRAGRGQIPSSPVTLVGQLCTPKDVFARQVHVDALDIGDLVAFAMAGAYGWNISHHDFLRHPKPAFHYIP